MKKISKLFFVFLLLSSVITTAQNSKNKKTNSTTTSSSSNKESGAGCFNESSKVLNIGIGFGSRGYYSYSRNSSYSYHSSPAISLSYEQSLPKKVGPGYLGLGVYFGYQSAYLKYNDYYYNNNKYYYQHNWKYMVFAARGAYHLDDLMIENAELYFGAIIGLRYQTYSFETNTLDPNKNFYELNNSSIYPSYSLFIGGRYYFTKKVAVFGEVGYGISYLTAGLSFKF